MSTLKLFPTFIEHGRFSPVITRRLIPSLKRDLRTFKELDDEGRNWSKLHYPGGYTSYGSLDALHIQSSVFGELEQLLNPAVRKFSKSVGLDLQGGELKMTHCWVNEMPQGARHTMHIHPLSVVSGTFYLEMPKGASSIRFEDPRASRFMARPPMRAKASKKGLKMADSGTFSVSAKAGDFVLFESWLPHEVSINSSKTPRLSISFNYEWA